VIVIYLIFQVEAYCIPGTENSNCICETVFLNKSVNLSLADPYFANAEIQEKDPQSYALEIRAKNFHRGLDELGYFDHESLISAIKEDSDLHQRILNYPELSLDEKVSLLRKLFKIEVNVLGIKSPDLVIGKAPNGGPAYFEFDPEVGGTGRVYLDPIELAKEDHPFSARVLLLHETRHSAQFQLGQSHLDDPVFIGYRESFKTQKRIFINHEKVSFCDFTTLLNEYEAFQFANFVMNRLSDGKINIKDMGTPAGQFDENGKILFDLFDFIKRTPRNDIYDEFNRKIKEFSPN